MRAFIGIEIPDDIRRAYSKTCFPLRKTSSVSFTKPEKLHITLAFFKDLSIGQADMIRSMLTDMNREHFEISCDKIGLFKRRGIPSAVFIQTTSEILNEYAAALHKKLEYSGIAFDKKPFVPHITLARIKSAEDETVFNKIYSEIVKSFKKLSFQAASVHLFSSNMITYKKEFSIEFIVPQAQETESGE